jgi:hypothetical protein
MKKSFTPFRFYVHLWQAAAQVPPGKATWQQQQGDHAITLDAKSYWLMATGTVNHTGN